MKNNNLYNDKELWDDGDLNWYDYGFRNYDPQIGRFTQLDPLTFDYPELTNYQYASCEPIANIDEDGLEKCPILSGGFLDALDKGSKVASLDFLKTGVKIANTGLNAVNNSMEFGNSKIFRNSTIPATTQQVGNLTAITLGGAADAVQNGLTLGLYDAFGGNHETDYTSPEEQAAYLRGRLMGAVTAMGMGDYEMGVGGTAALASAGPTLGGGIVVGGAVAGHGALVIAVAGKDVIWSTLKLHELYKLYSIKQGADDVQKSAGGTQVNSKTLWKGSGKERLDVENPNPTQRPGQIHYQDNKGNKYIYDPKNGAFRNTPKKVNDLLKNSKFKEALEKALKYLGLKK